MRRRELLKMINEHARRNGKKVTYREGGNHTFYTVGETVFPIGRHVEVKPGEARNIVRKLVKEFGEGWSKK
jgi:hypothetical protein